MASHLLVQRAGSIQKILQLRPDDKLQTCARKNIKIREVTLAGYCISSGQHRTHQMRLHVAAQLEDANLHGRARCADRCCCAQKKQREAKKKKRRTATAASLIGIAQSSESKSPAPTGLEQQLVQAAEIHGGGATLQTIDTKTLNGQLRNLQKEIVPIC